MLVTECPVSRFFVLHTICMFVRDQRWSTHSAHCRMASAFNDETIFFVYIASPRAWDYWVEVDLLKWGRRGLFLRKCTYPYGIFSFSPILNRWRRRATIGDRGSTCFGQNMSGWRVFSEDEVDPVWYPICVVHNSIRGAPRSYDFS